MSEPMAAQLLDAELAQRIRGEDEVLRSEAASEIVRRHKAAVLAYAHLCFGEPQAAEDVADEALAQTLRSVRSGNGPTEAWRPHLVTEVRRTAVRWAATGRESGLASSLTSWLRALPGADRPESAARAAEENSALLRAFRSLPGLWQAVLWNALVETAEHAGPLPGLSPNYMASRTRLAQQGFFSAYLRGTPTVPPAVSAVTSPPCSVRSCEGVFPTAPRTWNRMNRAVRAACRPGPTSASSIPASVLLCQARCTGRCPHPLLRPRRMASKTRQNGHRVPRARTGPPLRQAARAGSTPPTASYRTPLCVPQQWWPRSPQ